MFDATRGRTGRGVAAALIALGCRTEIASGPPLVSNVTAEVAAGGWLAATVSEDDVEASLCAPFVAPPCGVALDRGWTPSPGDGFGVWRVPAGIGSGPYDAVFTRRGRSTSVPVFVGPAWFRDVAADVGLDLPRHVIGWDLGCAESLMAVGFADVDLDGDPDALVADLLEPSALLVADRPVIGELPTYTPSGALDGVDPVLRTLVSAAMFADADNDGDPDLFLGRRGPNVLLRNEFVPTGTLRFVDATPGSGFVARDQRTTGVGWGDYDGDGDLDLYEVNHAWCFPEEGAPAGDGSGDHLYRNDGGLVFTEVTGDLPDNLGQVSGRYGFAALWIDMDRDGRQDLWVINDFVQDGGRSVLWRNDGPDGAGGHVFTDVTQDSAIAALPDPFGKATNAMGAAVGDLNRDGLPDVAYSNIGPNFLLTSAGPWAWRDVSDGYEVRRALLPWGQTSVTWGTHLFDVDNDGDLDLGFAAGPLRKEEAQLDALLVNPGDGGPFVDASFAAGVASPGHGAASAQVDLDGDGWLDWVVASWDRPLEVWHNQLGRDGALGETRNHWLGVALAGDGARVNRDAFGAVVELVRADGRVDTCFRNPMPSMASTGDPTCRFGLGDDTVAGPLRVVWPDGWRDEIAVDAVDVVVHVVRAGDGR